MANCTTSGNLATNNWNDSMIGSGTGLSRANCSFYSDCTMILNWTTYDTRIPIGSQIQEMSDSITRLLRTFSGTNSSLETLIRSIFSLGIQMSLKIYTVPHWSNLYSCKVPNKLGLILASNFDELEIYLKGNYPVARTLWTALCCSIAAFTDSALVKRSSV